MTPEQKQVMENTPFPIVFSCIDLILTIKGKIVFIKKSYKDDLLRLPGGMVDTTDLTLKECVRREAKEEINAEAMFMDFNDDFRVTSFLTQDSNRYNPDSSKHRLNTTLFHVRYDDSVRQGPDGQHYGLKAGDDADGIELVPIKNLFDVDWVSKNVMPGHIPLLYYWLGQFDGDRYL
jgi:ADP-ribose pyrophosphatase YjhB (NUDIX family)